MTEPNIVRSGDGMLLAPDPTVATRAAIDREIGALDDKRRIELHGEVNALRARLDAMDRAIIVFNDNLTRVPTETDKAVGNLQALMVQTFETFDEKFATIFERFRGVDAQFSQRDIAVAAALQAQKEAAGTQTDFFTTTGEKSEAAVAKQIDALLLTLTNATGTLDGKLQDLKERLTRIEATDINSASHDAGLRASVISLQSDVRELRESRSSAHGAREQGLDSRVVLFSLIGFLFTLIVIGIAVVSLVTR